MPKHDPKTNAARVAEHTPGPWYLSVPFESQYLQGKQIQLGNARECAIAVIRFNNPEQVANARLILSAPALLAALDYLQSSPNDPRAHRAALDALALAR